jgi:hypothetical protein
MFMKDEFVLGVNYWPIESAMNWWHGFDAKVVGEDFSRTETSFTALPEVQRAGVVGREDKDGSGGWRRKGPRVFTA